MLGSRGSSFPREPWWRRLRGRIGCSVGVVVSMIGRRLEEKVEEASKRGAGTVSRSEIESVQAMARNALRGGRRARDSVGRASYELSERKATRNQGPGSKAQALNQQPSSCRRNVCKRG